VCAEGNGLHPAEVAVSPAPVLLRVAVQHLAPISGAGDPDAVAVPGHRGEVEGADEVAERCVLFDQFVHDLLAREPGAIRFAAAPSVVAVHTHCHAKALTDADVTVRLARHLPGCEVRELDTGCCGMAGSFGALSSKYELSVQVAQPLVEQINALPAGAVVVACGTSCRHQISHLTDLSPVHVAELLADALELRRRTGSTGGADS